MFESDAVDEIADLIRQWLEVPIHAQTEVRTAGGRMIDLVVNTALGELVVEFKSTTDLLRLGQACEQLAALSSGKQIPVLAVPFMGPKARQYMASRGQSWLDLSGNADIRGPGLRILIEGHPNQFATPGRPKNNFSPRAARIPRVMLVEPDRWWQHKELVEATGLSAGFVSKSLKGLVDSELVDRVDDRWRPRSPKALLDTWSHAYVFSKHHRTRFHAVGGSGLAVLRSTASRLATRSDLQWAATGLAAAWMWTEHADFRMTTLFVSRPLRAPEALGLHPVNEGENVWVVVPQDPGVFYGSHEIAGIPCVHPIQAWLDLAAHPERANEAATVLRRQKLDWPR